MFRPRNFDFGLGESEAEVIAREEQWGNAPTPIIMPQPQQQQVNTGSGFFDFLSTALKTAVPVITTYAQVGAVKSIAKAQSQSQNPYGVYGLPNTGYNPLLSPMGTGTGSYYPTGTTIPFPGQSTIPWAMLAIGGAGLLVLIMLMSKKKA